MGPLLLRNPTDQGVSERNGTIALHTCLESQGALALLLLSVQVFQNRFNYEVVDRAIPLVSQTDQPFDWLLLHLLLWDIDRQLVEDLFLCHLVHPLIISICSSIACMALPVKHREWMV